MQKINPKLLNIGVYLAAPILLGVYAGFQLDKHYSTKNFWTLTLLIVGTVSSFYNLWKLIKELSK